MIRVEARDATASRMSVRQAIVFGVVAGVLASIVMVGYAMVAAWTKDTGFFTPLYHIASLWISQDSMMASMEDGMGGDAFHFEFGPAVVGALIHMATGAAYGALFALAVFRFGLGPALLALAGLVWGALVLAFSVYVGLPLAAEVFDSGDQITDMGEMAGWDVFVPEHLVFGLVAGLVLAALARRTSPGSA